MKKYFITGLIILLPLALTLAIVLFIFNLLTGPFIGIVQAFLNHNHLLQNGFLFLSASQVQHYVSQLLILVFLIGFTLLLGIFARWFFIHYLLRFWDFVIHRIPFVSTVYKTCQDVIRTIFTMETKSFKQVVLVPFPSPETQSVGLVTCENVPAISKVSTSHLVTVFVPTTPNPTSGFLMLFDPKDLIYLDMKVEDALKFVISCGVIEPPLRRATETPEGPLEGEKQ